MQEEPLQHFYNDEEKLSFIIDYLKLNVKEIANLWGVQANYISKLREQSHNSLKPMHLYAFSGAFDVSFKVFDKDVKTSEQLIALLEEHANKHELFKENAQVLQNIQGDWYAYFYPSNRFSEIYRIKTTVKLDGSVVDANGNRGQLFTGTNQSIIIKESKNSKNFVSITFDNHQVAYDMFHFSLVSKRNHNNLEMFNYGFFSRYEIEADMLKDILGEKSKVQLKMECDFAERISEYVEIVG
jgi:hypothetical protein